MTPQLGLNYFAGNLFAQPYIIYQIVTPVYRELSDSVGVVDDLTTTIAIIIKINDSIEVTDDLSRITNIVRQNIDNLGITDSLDKILTYNVYIVDSVALSDALVYAGQYTKDVPKLMKTLDFKPIGMVESSKAKAKIILVSKPKWS